LDSGRTKSCIVLYPNGGGETDVGMVAVVDSWHERELRILRACNQEFQKLRAEEQKVMVDSIKEDEQIVLERQTKAN